MKFSQHPGCYQVHKIHNPKTISGYYDNHKK